MEIRKGTTRIAFVDEGSTVKVPRPTLIYKGFQSLTRLLMDSRPVFWKIVQGNEHCTCSPLFNLQGLFANQREGRHWHELRDIVVPTRSLLGGLLAIQPTTADIAFSKGEPWNAMSERLYEEIFDANGQHTLQNPRNYGMHEGKVRIRDFGGLGIPQLLMKYQETFHAALAQLTEQVRGRVHCS